MLRLTTSSIRLIINYIYPHPEADKFIKLLAILARDYNSSHT